MERDEKEDNLKAHGMEKGVQLKAIVKTINSCCVSFNAREKQYRTKMGHHNGLDITDGEWKKEGFGTFVKCFTLANSSLETLGTLSWQYTNLSEYSIIFYIQISFLKYSHL